MSLKKNQPNPAWLSLVLAFCFTACEKVIDFTPQEEQAALVIEGTVTGEGSQVKIVRTVGYNQPNEFPPVSGAGITISNSAGEVFTLEETTPGIYTHPGLTGISGEEYRLDVSADGNSYQAQSTMPAPVSIDRLGAEEVNDEFGDSVIAVNVWFTDPPGKGNYYVFRLEHNGEMTSEFYTFEDHLHNGQQIRYQLIKDDPEGEEEDDPELLIQPGDSVRVFLLSVDKDVYRYFKHLGWLADSGGPNAPTSNPTSNIRSDCLGYFSAHTISQAAFVIPQ